MQSENYADGEQMRTEGKLTSAWIVDKARNDQLSGGQIKALRDSLKSVDKMKSNPVKLDDLMGQINDIKYVEGGLHDSVSANAAALREVLTVARYGKWEGGEQVVAPSITGEDYAKLNKQLDTAEKSLASQNPYYTQVKRQIERITGYSDMMSSFMGNEAGFEANRDAMAALHSYMDTLGGDADPRDWFNEFGDGFRRENYNQLNAEKFIDHAAPQFSGPDFKNEDGTLDRDKIIFEAAMQESVGTMPRWQLERLVQQMSILESKKRNTAYSGGSE
jgi:hypothetical protein